MLDIGWQEFTLVAFILLIIVGPKDLPKVLKSIFKFIDKIKNYAYDFKSSVNDMDDELELSELRNDVLEMKKDNTLVETKKTIYNLIDDGHDLGRVVGVGQTPWSGTGGATVLLY